MKPRFNNMIFAIVLCVTLSVLCSCTKKLERDEAERLITKKFELPLVDVEKLHQPEITIWTFDWNWNVKGEDIPSITIDEIIATGIYSKLVDYSSSLEDKKKMYIARGEFEEYKKLSGLGLIKFQSFHEGKNESIDRYGNKATSMYNFYSGNNWKCVFSLTPKANELGIINWQFNSSKWVLDDITGIFNNESDKSAEVEFTLKTNNPSAAAILLGEWVVKKQNLKVSFKLYDDGWRIE